ncbi:MAG: hypothetical protein WAV82_07230 [Methylobacter sp.]
MKRQHGKNAGVMFSWFAIIVLYGACLGGTGGTYGYYTNNA